MGLVFVLTQRNAANAQKIINDEFPELKKKLDGLQIKYETLKEEGMKRETKVAEERGTLNERIRQLEDRVSHERTLREQLGNDHSKTLAVMETQLTSMKEIQQDLQDRLLKEIEERTKLAQLLAEKTLQIDHLLVEALTLRKMIEEKDLIIAELKSRLGEP